MIPCTTPVKLNIITAATIVKNVPGVGYRPFWKETHDLLSVFRIIMCNTKCRWCDDHTLS